MSKALVSTEGDVTIKDAEFCIKTERDFTETVYHNICTGETYVKPTGVYDYMLGIPIAIIVALIPIVIIHVVFFD